MNSECLNEEGVMAEVYGLNKKPMPNHDNMTINLVSAREAGSCNFCTRRAGQYVYQVSSDDPDRHLSVRFCSDCLAQLRHLTNEDFGKDG